MDRLGCTRGSRALTLTVVAALTLFLLASPVASAGGLAGTAGADPATALTTVLSDADTAPAAILEDVLAGQPKGGNGAVTGRTECGISTGLVTEDDAFDPNGHFTVTPSGNAVLVCHGEVAEGPPRAVILQDIPCALFVPGKPTFITTESHTVITPSGEVILVCHFRS